MKCNEIRELMPDLATRSTSITGTVEQHLRECGECSAQLEGFRKTMAVLDEWTAPEPSPYFDTRLQARLREEKSRQPASWWNWVRKPALAAALAVVAVVGVTLYRGGMNRSDGDQQAATTPAPMIVATAAPVSAEPGTAVGDLQALDKNHDLYFDFDVLDDLQVQSDVNANP